MRLSSWWRWSDRSCPETPIGACLECWSSSRRDPLPLQRRCERASTADGFSPYGGGASSKTGLVRLQTETLLLFCLPVGWALLLPKITIQDFSVVFVTECVFFTNFNKNPQTPQFTGTGDESQRATAQQLAASTGKRGKGGRLGEEGDL